MVFRKKLKKEDLVEAAPEPQEQRRDPANFPKYPQVNPQPPRTLQHPQPMPHPHYPQPEYTEDNDIAEELYQIENALLRIKYKLGLR